jgi:AraC-like DNA-binding protein
MAIASRRVQPERAGPVSLVDRDFSCFEQLREAALSWQLDFRQLAGGQANHRLFQASANDFELIHCAFNVPYDQRSASPAHLRTFSILTEERAPATWCAQPFGSQALACFRPGAEFSSISSGNFSNFVFSLPEELLYQVAESRFGLDWEAMDNGIQGTIQQLKAPDIGALREWLCRFVSAARQPAGKTTFAAQLSQLAALLIRALAAAKSLESTRGSSNRRQYFLAARDYIDRNPDSSVTVQTLCQHVGVSERTLENSFRESAFLTPKSYEIRQRIARAHRDLVRTTNEVSSVGEVANRWGFWHMGQFARDYQKIYRESPSTTISRSMAS